MRALRWEDVGEVHLDDVPVPDLAEGEVLLETCYAGICATDRELIAGHLGIGRRGVIPGHEIVAVVHSSHAGLAQGTGVVVDTVVACGACPPCRSGDSLRCHVGGELGFDRDGGWADFVAVDADRCHPIPTRVQPLDAVLIEPLVCPYGALRAEGSLAGGRVTIIGSGIAAWAFAQCARLLGAAEVSVVVNSGEREQLFIDLGVDRVAGPAEAAVSWAAESDLVVDAVGSSDALLLGLTCARTGGRIIAYGLASAEVERFPLRELVTRNLSMIGRTNSIGHWPDVVDHVAAGRLTVSGVVDRVVHPDLVPELLRRPPTGWKAVIDFRSPRRSL